MMRSQALAFLPTHRSTAGLTEKPITLLGTSTAPHFVTLPSILQRGGSERPNHQPVGPRWQAHASPTCQQPE